MPILWEYRKKKIHAQVSYDCINIITDKSNKCGLLAGLKSDAQFILIADDGWKRFFVGNVLVAI